MIDGKIEDVLKARKITTAQYETYMHWQGTELGRKQLREGTMNTFMDEVPFKEMTAEQLAFNEGRRSVFRDVHVAIDIVETAIKEALHDGAEQ
jgi:hypothetical protein